MASLAEDLTCNSCLNSKTHFPLKIIYDQSFIRMCILNLYYTWNMDRAWILSTNNTVTCIKVWALRPVHAWVTICEYIWTWNHGYAWLDFPHVDGWRQTKWNNLQTVRVSARASETRCCLPVSEHCSPSTQEGLGGICTQDPRGAVVTDTSPKRAEGHNPWRRHQSYQAANLVGKSDTKRWGGIERDTGGETVPN